MDINILLLEINRKLDTLLKMHGIDSQHISNTVPGTYSKENAEIFEKYKEQAHE